MRVALVSDLHANPVAIAAVRRDITHSGADLTVCLGDVATLGARPREVLDEVAALGGPCVLGNHDEFLFRPELVRAYNEAPVIATTPAEQLDEALDGRRACVMAGGHTHLQMVRQHRGDLLVNPGSVGMPIREYAAGGPPAILDHAEYATIDADDAGGVAVTLRRVALDRRALRAQAESAAHPLRAYLAAQYA